MDTLYAGCEAIASTVQAVANALKYVINTNYEAVSALCRTVATVVSLVLSGLIQVKDFTSTVIAHVVDFLVDVYSIFSLIFSGVLESVLLLQKGISACYAHTRAGYLSCVNFVSASITAMVTTVHDVNTVVWSGLDMGVGLFIGTVSAALLFVSTLGHLCVRIVVGVWVGLGFVLSSIAYFPVYVAECLDRAWNNCVNALHNAMTATPKETYLGIVMLCLVYLTLSNVLRYLHCNRLSLFHRTFRRRRRSNVDWHIDRNFESDYEDLFSSDHDDQVWDGSNNAGDDNASDSDTNETTTVINRDVDNYSDVSDDDDDSDDEDDDDNDSDEYTVATEEESDTEGSINSQTFSTESSDHEIEVQLPPLDERYSLRSRSSTPCRVYKPVSSPEDFTREMERERDKRKCVVCQDRIKSVLVMPCRHMCLCVACADQIVRCRLTARRVCPLCRTKIEKVMNVYV